MVAQIDHTYWKIGFGRVLRRLASYGLFEGRPLTTRGRWINPLLFYTYRFIDRHPLQRGVEKPVFIIGMGRSGTTILGVVLSIHREVGYLNEPKALWHAIYPFEDVIGSYSSEPGHYRLNGEDVLPETADKAHRLFGSYLRLTGARRLVDKYPELVFRAPFVLRIFPDAKFLFLVRNGRDAIQSIDNWSAGLGERHGDAIYDWWGENRRKWNLLIDQIIPTHSDLASYATEMRRWTSHLHMAAVEWIVTMREGVALQRRYPHDVLRVDYEDLVTAPRKTIPSILRFCELPDDVSVIDYADRVIRPARPYEEKQLPSCISAPFSKLMETLGYR